MLVLLVLLAVAGLSLLYLAMKSGASGERAALERKNGPLTVNKKEAPAS